MRKGLLCRSLLYSALCQAQAGLVKCVCERAERRNRLALGRGPSELGRRGYLEPALLSPSPLPSLHTMPAAPPYHTTLPHLTKDNWRDEASKKRDQLAALVPAEWRLPPEALEAAGDDVRGVAASSGILSERELEITELNEVEEVRPRSASPPPRATAWS